MLSKALPLIITFHLLAIFPISAQNFEWVQSTKSDTNGLDTPSTFVQDSQGNFYISGILSDTTDFDPGPATFKLFPNDSMQFYVLKLDSIGQFVWAKSVGGTEHMTMRSIAIDPFDNLYFTGQFYGTVDFDPGQGQLLLTTNGYNDIYLLKLDNNGDLLFAKQFGDIYGDGGISVNCDQNGNVILSGNFDGYVDFDPSPSSSSPTPTNDGDMFVAKYDAFGNYLWSTTFGDPDGFSSGQIAKTLLDNEGNILTSGLFFGTIDLNPSSSQNQFTSAGNFDFFIQKLDSTGSFQWAHAMGGSSLDFITDMTLDSLGNVITSGLFYSDIDMNPGPGTDIRQPLGGYDCFVHKLSANGTYVWANTSLSNSIDYVSSIETDRNGNLYLSGGYYDSLDCDPGMGESMIYSNGETDAFIQKWTPQGQLIWCQSFGGLEWDHATSILVDHKKQIHLSGYFSDTVDFDFSLNSETRNSLKTDLFFLKLSQCVPDTSSDVLSACDSITWIDGNTYYDDNNTATYLFNGLDGCDSLIALDLTINQSDSSNFSVTACENFTWVDGNTYTSSSNNATHIFTNLAGCDSVVTLDLIINNGNTGEAVVSACDSFTWINGSTYTEDNNSAIHTLTNIFGCDSIVTLDLTIHSSKTQTYALNACDSYTWIDGVTYTESNYTATHVLTTTHGCDSTFKLHLNIKHSTSGIDEVTACDSFTWIDGNTYTENNNTAIHRIENVAGCDSILTLDLRIDSVSNTEINLVGFELSAVNINASYSWLDCNTNFVLIPGETSQTFSPVDNGSYAVEFIENGCTDTSECLEVIGLGVPEKSLIEVTVSPNPSTENFTVVWDSHFGPTTIYIYSVNGQLLKATKIGDQQVYNFGNSLAAGTYFILIQSEGIHEILKVVKI